jgi:hypothetical protein
LIADILRFSRLTFCGYSTIEHLVPLFLQLLKDDASEVRLNIISKLDGVNKGQCPPVRFENAILIRIGF